MFAASGARRKYVDAAEGLVDRPLRRPRRGFDHGGTPARVESLARDHRRGTADEAMTKADQAVESAADRIDAFVRESRERGGIQAKVGDAFADDPDFLRRLKPSLVKARLKGESPPSPPAGRVPRAPSGPQLERAPKRGSAGKSPWLVLGAALVGGYALAKLVDWRGHAHPRL
jgi:hypothetical protein